MPIESITRPALRRRIAAAMQDDIVHSTATGGTTTTLVDTGKLDLFSDDSLNGAWVYIHTGTELGTERAITDFTGSTGTITVTEAWSAGPDSTSQYEVHRRFTVEQYDAAIDQAIRASRWGHLHQVRRRSLITDSAIVNPLFEDWNSAATLPDGWTNDTTHLDVPVLRPEGYSGRSVTLEARVWSDAATVIRAVDAGSTAYDATHSANSQWERVSVTVAPSVAMSELRIVLPANISTVSRVAGDTGSYALKLVDTSGNTALIDWIFMPSAIAVQEYAVDTDDADGTEHGLKLSSIHEVRLSQSLPGGTATGGNGEVLTYPVGWHDWTASSGTLKDGAVGNVLKFHKRQAPGRLIEYSGMGVEVTGGDNDDVLRVNSEVIELYALYRLKMVTDPREAQWYLDEWQRLRNENRVNWPAFSRLFAGV